jgi:hypothetical protein
VGGLTNISFNMFRPAFFNYLFYECANPIFFCKIGKKIKFKIVLNMIMSGLVTVSLSVIQSYLNTWTKHAKCEYKLLKVSVSLVVFHTFLNETRLNFFPPPTKFFFISHVCKTRNWKRLATRTLGRNCLYNEEFWS